MQYQACETATGVRVHLYVCLSYTPKQFDEGRAFTICGAVAVRKRTDVVSRSMFCVACTTRLHSLTAAQIGCAKLVDIPPAPRRREDERERQHGLGRRPVRTPADT